MVVSFAQLWEQIEKDKARRSPLMSSGEDNRALVIVRTGKEMHKEGQTPFWDEFISLCGNTDGLAQLLGVKPDQVRTWPAKIQEALNKLDQQNVMDPSQKDKTEMIPTGDNGAITMNADPVNTNIGDEA